ncbi:hypothetical protein BD324DRAFT_620726 [Kockovaella imperatae]|uniref:THUMP domain-containing protein n=1 Tax=Kockovaella imperatae TaxID=4999 RepID=A0A1Y1UK93_9TREE|nr:hypothetical protein BD324DRAFT_620726 [Kockovaella imperatae]ORX38402.1 hypothetical protein BD324DRAFT_620726 [Kockovaella imperatae]
MSDAGPSQQQSGGGHQGRGGSSSGQKNKSWKYKVAAQAEGQGRGGRGQGRGGRGGRGRGGGGGRGGSHGAHGDAGGGSRSDAAPGPKWESSDRPNHLGRYRDDPVSEIMMAPGICVTTVRDKERSAERELVEYLERIADELYPDAHEVIVKAESRIGEEEDFEEMLKQELADMSVEKKSSRFRLCKHETPCVIYVEVLPPLDPARLVVHMMEQIEKNARCPFRYVQRVVPVLGTCGATLPQLSAMCPEVLKEGFQSDTAGPVTFGILYNSRNSQRLDRMDVIKSIAEHVSTLDPSHTVDLKNPDRTILVETNKNRLGLSVVKDYERFKKYNAYALAGSRAQAELASSEAAPINAEATKSGPSRSQQKHAHRDIRAAKMAAASSTPSNKRKLEDMQRPGDGVEHEAFLDTMAGEGASGGTVGQSRGDEWQEIIEGGRVVKMRKEEPETDAT